MMPDAFTLPSTVISEQPMMKVLAGEIADHGQKG